jgi:hypothetical protein
MFQYDSVTVFGGCTMKKIRSVAGPLMLALSVVFFFLGALCGVEVIGAVLDSAGILSFRVMSTMKFFAGLGTCFAIAGYVFLRLGEIILPVRLGKFLPEIDQ